MSNTEWFPRQGLETVEKRSNGFSLLALKIAPSVPSFEKCVISGESAD